MMSFRRLAGLLARSFCITTLLVSFAGAAGATAQVAPAPTTLPEHTPDVHIPVHGEPQILDVQWQGSSHIHPGSVIASTVRTSDNVYYVEARVRYWNVIFHNVAPGRFEVQYHVPVLPPVALGPCEVDIIVRSVDGVEVKRVYQFTYSYF